MVLILKINSQILSKENIYEFVYLRIELGPNVVGATDWSISFKLSGSVQIDGPEIINYF